MRLFALAALAAAASAGALAAPSVDPLFSDGAVVQRDRPIHVRGRAAAGEQVTVRLGSAAATVSADGAGEWIATLPAMPAGGPHRLSVTGAGGAAAPASSLLIGDVWLCSGQSNMEWPLRRSMGAEEAAAQADDPQLRILTVPQRTALDPERFLPAEVKWQTVTPETAPHFSAVCYHMVRELRRHTRVPIGAINSSWGGTRIVPWMDEAAARSVGYAEDADLLALYRRDPAAASRQFAGTWEAWWRDRAPTAPWRDSDALRWQPVPEMTYWNGWEGADLAGFDGLVWARRRFSLTPEEAASGATLSLGVIDDFDQTWVNGIGVGNSFGWSFDRNYKLPAGVLKAGPNEILVNIGDEWGPGGMQGPAEKIRLAFADGTARPLGDGWEYSVVGEDVGRPPRGPWQTHTGISTIYNAMIAPLGPLGLTGVAWYQGESDVGIPGYDRRLAALVATWRRQFRDPRLPFLAVGLAGFGTPVTAPVDSGWARLMDEQRLAASRDPRLGLVPAIDLGEPKDIHPPNKEEVGLRLASAARAIAYGDARAPTAPLPLSARRTGQAVTVRFTDSLRVLGGNRPVGFELCGPAQASCRYVDARVSGDSAILADSGGATRVRYAWSDYPMVNLYAGDLPVPAFELAIP